MNKWKKPKKTDLSAEELIAILGKGRAKKGMFEGDLENGELEIGQVSAQINEILPVREIMNQLISGFNAAKQNVSENDKFSF